MLKADFCIEDAERTYHRHLFYLPYDDVKGWFSDRKRKYIENGLRRGVTPGIDLRIWDAEHIGRECSRKIYEARNEPGSHQRLYDRCYKVEDMIDVLKSGGYAIMWVKKQ